MNKLTKALTGLAMLATTGCATVQPGLQSVVQTEPQKSALSAVEPDRTVQEIKEKYACDCVGIGKKGARRGNDPQADARFDYMVNCLDNIKVCPDENLAYQYVNGNDNASYVIAFPKTRVQK